MFVSPHQTKFTLDSRWEQFLKLFGVEAMDIFREAGLTVSSLNGPGTKLSTSEWIRLWFAVEERLPEDFPIRLIENLRHEFFDPPIFAAYCSPNLDVALSRLQKFKPLTAPMEVRLHRESDTTRVEMVFLEPVAEIPSSFAGTEVCFYVQLARMTTGERIVPLRVTTPATLPALSEYRDFLGTSPSKGSSVSVTFSKEDTLRPFLTHNDTMWDFFGPTLCTRLSELSVADQMSTRARSCLFEMLPSGQASVGELAERLMVSRRTLQRKLKSEGTSFKSLLGSVREELAKHYLLNSKLPYEQISLLLGYEEPTSFFRAFQARTGATPRRFRAGLAG